MKKIVSLLLVSTIILLCMPMSVMALSGSDAAVYNDIINGLTTRGIYDANSYLVDFDGDGNEELFLCYRNNDGYTNVEWSIEVYSGYKVIAQETYTSYFFYDYNLVTNSENSNKTYLVRSCLSGGAIVELDETITYTVEDGKWKQIDKFNYKETGNPDSPTGHFQINGAVVSGEEYYAEKQKYNLDDVNALEKYTINGQELAEMANTDVSGYEDILPTMSQSEKQGLFDDFLCRFSTYDVDYRTVSDYELLEEILPAVRIDSNNSIGIEIEDGIVLNSSLDKFTLSAFGRIIDGSKFGPETVPEETSDGYFFWRNGQWCYAYGQGRGGYGAETHPEHLYQLENDYYYAVQRISWIDAAGVYFYEGIYSYLLKKNNDGSYRLIRSYKDGQILTNSELAAMVNPSDWAVAELNEAEKAGLVPELDGEPFMTENATRLQFAQLAVSLAETITGKQLPQNKSVAFKDCNDAAVLKAYQAGIVNGVSDTEFAPNESLTREQLATMIWRTVKYIQKETNKEKLTNGGDISGFADAGDVSDYANEAVAALAKYDIMKGTSETELSPKGKCSVEQSIILIYRTYLKIK